MSKDLKKTARGLAALGRGEDKMLVHMTPREVEGLQALAVATGGSLTINPHTGLPEAGWLSTFLPLFAGGAAAVLSGGTLVPILAGAAAGGVGAKVEGEDPLMGAFMGGLGGWGGAGLASGLMGAGKSAVGQAVQGAATEQAATQAAMNTGMNSLGQGAMSNSAAALTPGSSVNALNTGLQNAIPAAGGVAPSMTPAQITGQQAAEQAMAELSKKQAFQGGLRQLTSNPAATLQQTWGGMTGGQKLGVGATAMGVANASSSSSKGPKEDPPYYYHTSASIDPNGYVSFGPGAWDKEYDYERLGTYNPYNDSKYAIKRAEGGEVPAAEERFVMPAPPPVENPNPNQLYMQNLQKLLRQPPPMPSKPYQQELSPTAARPLTEEIAAATKGKTGFGKILATAMTAKNRMDQPSQVRYTYDPVNGFTKLAGGGGISGLPEASSVPTAGRFIKGPGDGVSDSIPAMIDGQQPAALSNNEFVVDAMTMAKLGNGSPEAGAQRMYEWQQRVHAMPTAPGKDLKAHKYLPG